MHRSAQSVLLACLLILAGGCASNAVRLETAGRVSTAATAVVDHASTALTSARQARLAANAALIASDPSCSPGTEALHIYMPNSAFSPDGRPAPLCAVSAPQGGFVQRPGFDIVAISVRPVAEDAIKPTLALVAAVAEYQGALAKILATPNADVQKELEGIMAKASTAKAFAEGLSGETLPKLPDLKSKQATSAVALIQFIDDLLREARKVEDVRKLVVDRGAKVMAVVPELRAQLRLWSEIVQGTDLATQTNGLLRAYEAEKKRSTFEQRLAFVQRVNAAWADETALPGKQRALGKVLDSFVEVHASLVEALNGNYTPEMKRRIARLNEERLLSAIKLTAGAFSAWGVL